MAPSSIPASGPDATPLPSNLGTPNTTQSTRTTPVPTSHSRPTPTADTSGDASDTAAHNAEKRVRACDSCRGLKVRCEPDEADPTGVCKRCKKAGRECIFTAPTKKRQKKADSKVAELERKIDALTATLQTTQQQRAPAPGDTTPQDRQGPGGVSIRADSSVETNNWKDPVAYGQSVGDWRREELPGPAVKRRKTVPDSNTRPSLETMELPGPGVSHLNFLQQSQYRAYQEPPDEDIGPVGDVVDRELLSIEAAELLFKRFTTEMAVHFPVVVFPPGYTVQQLRSEKPTLFLAVMAVSSGLMHPALYKALNKEIIKVLAEKCVVNGNKSLELVQAYFLCTIWYFAPNRFEELKFYQLLHMSLAMALDLGLGSRVNANCGSARRMVGPVDRSVPAPGPLHKAFDKLFRLRGKTSFPDPISLESRRIFVGLYIACSNIAMSLRRPSMVRFSKYIAESINILDTSPEAYPSDKVLVQMCKLQRIGEEVFIAFEFDDPAANISITDPRIQLSLRTFIRQIEEWKDEVPSEVFTHSLRLMYLTITCFTNEIALQPPGQRPPENDIDLATSTAAPSTMTALHIESVSRLAAAAHEILKLFLNRSVDLIRALPVFQLARGVYSSVVLLRLSIHTARNKNLKTLFEDLKLDADALVGALIERYKQAAADDKCRPATKFIVVLTMVRNIARMKRMRQCPGDNPKTVSSEKGAARCDCRGPDGQAHHHDHHRASGCDIATEVITLAVESEGHEANPNCPLLRTSAPPPSGGTASSPILNRKNSDVVLNADSPLHMLSTAAHERARAAQSEMQGSHEHPTTPSSTSTYAPPPEQMAYQSYSPANRYASDNSNSTGPQPPQQQPQQDPHQAQQQQQHQQHTQGSQYIQPHIHQQTQHQQQQQQQLHHHQVSPSNVYGNPAFQSLQDAYFDGVALGGGDINNAFLGIASDEFPDLSTGMGQDFGASMEFMWQNEDDPFAMFPSGMYN
ncbi:hypothetical protein BJ508DRAFT_320478 [Ascobolus immersus RN42]|uniref:Zn(2)-C6 fungal-type domain-containing protein n=1 Tax=Ascobolus immersus RN42 TaxID=1160509 RepID=A0A3N4IMU9_ASCIM|nr:hypothetical protein BJ508DRAFT_320478 [Ascobolus immersus RN42]